MITPTERYTMATERETLEAEINKLSARLAEFRKADSALEEVNRKERVCVFNEILAVADNWAWRVAEHGHYDFDMRSKIPGLLIRRKLKEDVIKAFLDQY